MWTYKYNYHPYSQDELMHYGRKGMKWGENIFGKKPDVSSYKNKIDDAKLNRRLNKMVSKTEKKANKMLNKHYKTNKKKVGPSQEELDAKREKYTKQAEEFVKKIDTEELRRNMSKAATTISATAWLASAFIPEMKVAALLNSVAASSNIYSTILNQSNRGVVYVDL